MFHHRFTVPLVACLYLAGTASAAAKAQPPQEAPAQEAFANAHLLLTTDWLAEHGGDKGVTIVDARSSKDFAAGHVAGAVHLSPADTYNPEVRGNIGSAEQIATLLSTKGIAPSTHVVIYDGGRSVAAARVFWTLEVYGHAKVSVIDGGIAKWKAEERKLTTESSAPSPVKYGPGSPQPRISTLDQVLDDIEHPKAVMLDARSINEYKAGHIPGAVGVEWSSNYTSGDVPVFKSPSELLKLYGDQGVTLDKRVHAY